MRAEVRSELLPLLCGFPHTFPRSPHREEQNLQLTRHAAIVFSSVSGGLRGMRQTNPRERGEAHFVRILPSPLGFSRLCNA